MRNRWSLLMVVVGLTVVACGGSVDETTTTERGGATTEAVTPTTEPPEATTTTEAPAGPEGAIPEVNVGQTLAPPQGGEDITSGPVVVYWYRGANDGNYLALYTGSGIAQSEGLGLCPGNSIATTEFLHVSNTPSEGGACDGFPTPVASIQVCDGGVWIYETAIPGDIEGTLFGSLEWNATSGVIAGLYSQAATVPDMKEFEYGLASYSIPPWFTSDGQTVIACGAPTT